LEAKFSGSQLVCKRKKTRASEPMWPETEAGPRSRDSCNEWPLGWALRKHHDDDSDSHRNGAADSGRPFALGRAVETYN